MAKISELEELAAQDIDGTEKLPVVKNGVARQAAISDLGTPAAIRAETAADQAAAIVDETLSTSRKLKRNFDEILQIKDSLEPTTTAGTGLNLSRLTAASAPPEGTPVDIGALFLSNLAAAQTFRLEAYSRPLADGDLGANRQPGDGNAPNDVKFKDVILTRDDFAGPIDWASSDRQEVRFDLDFGIADGQTIIFFGLSMFDGAGVWLPMGAGICAGRPAEPDWAKGYFSLNGNNAGQAVYSGDGGTNAVAFRLYSREYELPKERPIGYRAEARGDVEAIQIGLTRETPELLLESPARPIRIPAGKVMLDAPAAPAIVGEAIDIVFDADGTGAPGRRLTYQYVGNVTVTRNSDSAVLTRGVDYEIQANTGYIYGLTNIATFAAKVDYTGHKSRYDLIYADKDSGVLGIAKGVDRVFDAEFRKWQAVLPDGKIPLFKAYVFRDEAAANYAVELIPIYDVRDRWHKSQVNALTEYRRAARGRLPKMMKRLRRGERVDIAFMGTSRVHHRNGGAFPSLAEQLIPGGPTRDHQNFYTRQLPTFAEAGIETFDETDPDFAELLSKDGQAVIRPGLPAGSIGYTKEGWMYHFRDALAAYGGSEVNVLNFGIGGTDSGDGTGGINRYNGSAPELKAAVKAAQPDVVCIAYGMNEPGIAATYTRVRDIAQEMIDSGIEVIVFAEGQANSFGKRMSQATWTELNDRLERAAADAGAAFVPMHPIMGEGFEGAAGFSRKVMSGADLYVHQGLEEDRAIGEFGAGLIL